MTRLIKNPNRETRAHERGGIVMLACLMIIVFLSLTVFTLSRNVLRETAITGSVLQAGRSETAADAGIDWYLTWAQPGADASNSPKALALQNSFTEKTRTMDIQFTPMIAKSDLDDDMALQEGDGKTAKQAFDVELRVVGLTSESATGNPSGSKDIRDALKTVYWELNSRGRSVVSNEGDAQWQFYAERAARFRLRLED